MPVTRDGFFGAHLVSGVLFAIVPNVLVYSLAALMVPGEIAAAPLMTLAAACLQYLFYLGAAWVAVQLAGNRMGLVLAYFGFRYNLPLTMRSGLYPLLKERINGPIGDAVDAFALVGTIAGIAICTPSYVLYASQD